MDLPENPSAGIPEPAERLLRLPEVMERVGLRRTAIYQRMREGRFPASRSLSSRSETGTMALRDSSGSSAWVCR